MMYGNWPYDNGGGMIGMFFFMLIASALVTAGIIAILRRSDQGPRFVGHHDTALDMLSVRYAKGEISKDEYLDIRKQLSAK